MNHSFHLCIVAVAIIALTMCLIVETAPPAKGETGRALRLLKGALRGTALPARGLG